MSKWVSFEGELHPAKERVVLRNNSNKAIKNPSTEGKYVDEMVEPGQEFIYEGPCRQALFELWEQDKKNPPETMGSNFRKSPEFLRMLRELNFKSEKEFLAYYGYDKEKSVAEFESKASKVSSHELPARVRAIKTLGGGKDFSGQGNDRYGDFGLPKEIQ